MCSMCYNSSWQAYFWNVVLVVMTMALFSPTTMANLEGDLTLRPDPKGEPTTVDISIRVIDLDEINGANQNFTANVAVMAEWKDKRLAGGGGRRSMNLKEIWHPMLQIMNQQRVVKTFPEMAQVEPDGTVRVIQRYWGQFSNPLLLHDFPFDHHPFKIQVVSMVGGKDEIKLVSINSGKYSSGMADQLSLPDWKITSWSMNSNSYAISNDLNTLLGVNFNFKAERNIGYYTVKVFLPLLLIVIMSWIVFWIHPSESGSQISVSITSMLTLIAYRFALGSSLPKVSYLTQMDWFILIATLLVFFALIESVTTSRLVKMNKEALAFKIDRRCRIIFPMMFVLGCGFSYWL